MTDCFKSNEREKFEHWIRALINTPEQKETYTIHIKRTVDACFDWGITLRITPFQLNTIKNLLEVTEKRNR